MKLLENYLPEIVDSLRKIDPYKILLFGSLAEDAQEDAQDIDLAVILDSESLPRSFEERMKNKVAVRTAIFAISQRVPIDIVVYTLAEYRKLLNQNQPFIREINSGRTLYDKGG